MVKTGYLAPTCPSYGGAGFMSCSFSRNWRPGEWGGHSGSLWSFRGSPCWERPCVSFLSLLEHVPRAPWIKGTHITELQKSAVGCNG